jgi:hypothetical protein
MGKVTYKDTGLEALLLPTKTALTERLAVDVEQVKLELQLDYDRARFDSTPFDMESWIVAYQASTERTIKSTREEYIAQHSSTFDRSYRGLRTYYENDLFFHGALYNIFWPMKAIFGIFGGGRQGVFQAVSAGVSTALVAGGAYLLGMDIDTIKQTLDQSVPLMVAGGVAGDIVAAPLIQARRNPQLEKQFDAEYKPLLAAHYKRLETAARSYYSELSMQQLSTPTQ